MNFLRQFFETLMYPLRALLTSPGKLSSGARKLAGISLSARISILVGIFLVFVLLAAFVAHLSKPHATTAFLMKGEFYYAILPLIIVIPFVLYYVLRLWLEGDTSRYPDIDYAWKTGVAELNAHGLDLGYTPLFLVLGSPGELHEKSLFNATKLPFRVREVPTGGAALHWFAEPEGVYLVATNVGCLSKLAAVAKRVSEESKGYGVSSPSTPRAADVRGTMITDAPGDPTETTDVGPAPAAKSVMGTQLFPSSSGPRPTASIKGTVMISTEREDPVIPAESERRQVMLPQEQQREQELRLEYLCRLIIKARQPLAPINGVMTLLPYSIVQTGRREGSELQRVVKRDLNTLVHMFKLRCPVQSLVVGLEEESGFREMVRRVGREVTHNQRFGKGFTVGNPPTPEQLEAVATHACGLFEAKIYELFREKGSLSKPGNTKLYALLCKIRRTVRNPLTNILVNGYAQDSDSKRDDIAPLFFGGCYFAAAGEGDDRQAFVRGVFEKLPREQEELEWTDNALADEDKYRRWSQVAMWIDAALLIGLVAMVIFGIRVKF